MKIFIASSSKAIPKVKIVQDMLESLQLNEPIEAVSWIATGAIRVTYPTLDELLRQTTECHAGIFIFDKDETIVRINENTNQEERFYFPNNNVIFESGLFTGALGKHNVAIFLPRGVQQISDLTGVTYIPFNLDNTEETKRELKNWIEDDIRGDRPPASLNNLFMAPRKQIHYFYPLEKRLGLRNDMDEMCKHITNIRVMNLASNLLLTPSIIESTHEAQSKIHPTDVLWRILKKNRHAMIQIVLTEPEKRHMKDAITRMPNVSKINKEDYIYESWKKIAENISTEAVFLNAYNQHRLCCYAFDGVLPYAVFQVEFDEQYKEYDHVKIDLYSSTIGNEDERRSFVIWRDTDEANYTFFSANATQVMNNPQICRQISMAQLLTWKEQWERIQ